MGSSRRRESGKKTAPRIRRPDAKVRPTRAVTATAKGSKPTQGDEDWIARPFEPNAIRLTFQDLMVDPFRCANCGSVIEGARIYCPDVCSSEAEWVRYVRKRRAEGRSQLPDVHRAICIKLVKSVESGYDRKVSASVRKAVVARERGKCQTCGGPGTTIDHIEGRGTDELSNLQLLCASCHDEKTFKDFVPITEEWKRSHPEKWRKRQWLEWRTRQEPPVQLCDDGKNWDAMQKEIMRRRKNKDQMNLW